MKNGGEHKLDTTLGELIAAVSDAALEVCKDKNLAYLLAGIALQDIIENDSLPSTRGSTATSRTKIRYN
ncbi:MAG TPA: hypothetical protein VKH64_01955 [Candidatus Binatia bacterium]|nr:hypothetical protein [Candidatus Binatia bacterium]